MFKSFGAGRLLGERTIRRYRENYGIPAAVQITEDMILAHWGLERRLTEKILSSVPETRQAAFQEAYTELYSKLPWLNFKPEEKYPPEIMYAKWLDLIGDKPKKVYEVGAGSGGLSEYLAECGFDCVASEITSMRGNRGETKVKWTLSDAVDLEKYESAGQYDVVLSDQVIEHLHPQVLVNHFKGVYFILSPHGRYILSTPHCFIGPSDVSSVMGFDAALGMHLKEYTYSELKKALRKSGFKKVCAALFMPTAMVFLFSRLGIHFKAIASKTYLDYLCFIEKILLKIPEKRMRKTCTKLSMFLLFMPHIMLVAEKN